MGSYKQSLIAAMSFFLVLDAIVLAARVFVRAKIVRAFGWDDAFLCLSFFGYAMACTMGFISMHYGYAADGGDDQTYFDDVKMNRYYWANQFCLYISSGIVKIAVALVLYRLAITVTTRIILAISIVIVVVWTVIVTVFASYICAANPSGVTNFAGSPMCTEVGYFRMYSNIFMDLFFAVFPIPMVWKAGLTLRMRFIVCGLLGLGLIASMASIAKIVILSKLQYTTGYKEDWLHFQLLEWADIEVALAILAASAAALRPLVRRLTGHSLPDITESDKSTTAIHPTAAPPAGVTEGQSTNRFGNPQRQGDNASSAGASEQYELRSFNSKEPTLKTEDEVLGRVTPVKQFH